MAIVLICPDPTCQAPARIIDQWVFDSTDGPVEHVKTSCASGHVLTPMTAALAATRGDAAPHPSLDPPQSPAARRSRHLTTGTPQPAEGRPAPPIPSRTR